MTFSVANDEFNQTPEKSGWELGEHSRTGALQRTEVSGSWELSYFSELTTNALFTSTLAKRRRRMFLPPLSAA